MKRTNLVLNEELLIAATRILGAKTYSAAVNLALKEAIEMAKIRGLVDLFGTGVWEGDLGKMRADRGQSPKARRKKS